MWLKDRNIPGLAMSRSLGDYLIQEEGVTHEPVIEHFTIYSNDLVLVVASDGVWDIMSSSEVANIALEYFDEGDSEEAAKAIV